MPNQEERSRDQTTRYSSTVALEPDHPASRLPQPSGQPQWEDGSALVRGDGSEEEHRALLALLRDQGCNEKSAHGIAAILRAEGLTVARCEPTDDSRVVMDGETFRALAHILGRLDPL